MMRLWPDGNGKCLFLTMLPKKLSGRKPAALWEVVKDGIPIRSVKCLERNAEINRTQKLDSRDPLSGYQQGPVRDFQGEIVALLRYSGYY